MGTTISILTLNTIVVAAWFLSYKLGASVDLQLYIVLALSVSVTFVFYKFASMQIARNGRGLRLMKSLAKSIHFEKKGFWLKVQKLIDKI